MAAIAIAVGVLVALGTLRAQLADGQRVFRRTTDTVPVFATVTDERGRLVSSLRPGDFGILDNGRPQPIVAFDNTSQPIRLILLLDVSSSMAGNVSMLKADCREIVKYLWPDDLALVGTFGETIKFGSTFTRDPVEMLSVLPGLFVPDGATPLWAAIDRAIGKFGPGPGRPVVLVMSDGRNNASRIGNRVISEGDVIDHAQRSNVMVYAVVVPSRGAKGGSSSPELGLGYVAVETGGGYYSIGQPMIAKSTLAEIIDELHHQYLLGFVASLDDGKTHRIKVTAPAGFKVRARRAYRAPGQGM